MVKVKAVKAAKYADPLQSQIVQGGIIFLVVASIVLVAYAFKHFTP